MGIIKSYTPPVRDPNEPTHTDDRRCNYAGKRSKHYCSKRDGHTGKHGKYYKYALQTYLGPMCDETKYMRNGKRGKSGAQKWQIVVCSKPSGHSDKCGQWQYTVKPE